MKSGLLAALAIFAVTAASAAEFPSRVVLKIGSTSTSSYQVVGAVVADHIGKFLPGNPAIDIEVVDGGRGMQLARQVVTTEPTDGSVASMIVTSIVQSYVLNPSTYDFSPTEVKWIGALAKTSAYCVAKVGETTSIADDGVVLGATTKQSSFYANSTMIRHLVNPSAKVVAGFENETELVAALDRDEIDAYCGPTRSTYEREGRQSTQQIIGAVGRPDVLAALGVTDIFGNVTGIDRQAVDLALTGTVLFYGMVLPPTVDAEVLATYREAFTAMNADPGFQQDIKAKVAEYAAVSGEEVETFLQPLLKADPAVLARAVELLK